jgi:hypothetical protein
MKPWDLEVSSRDLGIGVVLRRGREVLDQHNLHSLNIQRSHVSKSALSNSTLAYLGNGPVDLHGPEGDNVDVVHQTVRVRHLSFS